MPRALVVSDHALMSLHRVPLLEQGKLLPVQEKENTHKVHKHASHTKFKATKINFSLLFQWVHYFECLNWWHLHGSWLPLKYFAECTFVANQSSAQNPSDAKTNYLIELQIYNKVYL